MNLQDWKLIVIVAAFCILALAAFFMICRRYEDGIVGNIALGLMGVTCGLILVDAWRDTLVVPEPTVCLLILCVAVFMLRYAWRVVMFHWADRMGFAKPRDAGDTTVRMKAIR